MRKQSSLMLGAVCLIFYATGCDSDRLQNFATFAGLGTTYITAFHGLTKAAGDAYIANSNATMIEARTMSGDPVAAASKLLPLVKKNADLTRDYLINLQKLDTQADLLGSYFAAIAQLSGTKSSDAISASTASLVDALKGVAPQIEDLKIGTNSVASFLPQAGTVAVAHFEVKALDKRLEADAPVIDHALALQEAAVAAISAQLAAALKDSSDMFEVSHIERPYASAGNLPASWAADREQVIRTTVVLDNAEGAKEASTKLRKSFEDLVSNKNAQLDLKGLLDAIQKMSGYVTAVNSTTAKSTK